MSPQFNIHKKRRYFRIFERIVIALFVVGIILSFFFLPFYYGEKEIGWSFVWNIKKEIEPSVAALQFGFAFIMVLFFSYLLRQERISHREKEELTSSITSLDVGFYRELPQMPGEFVEVNEALLRMLNYTKEEIYQLKPEDIYYDVAEYKKLREVLISKGSLTREIRFKKKDTGGVWAMVSAKATQTEPGEPTYFEYIIMDISERKWMEKEMSSAYLRFEAVIQNTPNIAIQGYGLDGRILEWNHASEILYGYAKHEILGRRGTELLSNEKDRLEFQQIFENMKRTALPAAPCERRMENKSGKELTVFSSVFPILQDGKVIEIFCMDVDITDRVETEKRLNEIKDRLESLALKDALTEVYNFRYFRERLAAEFERAKRTLSPMTVMMIDMDYFKSINDAYGHRFGDKILKQVARLLKTELRTNDVVARWGGEEFAIILPDTNRMDGLSVANKISDLLKTRSFGGEDHIIKIKCSIGVVNYPEDPLFSVEEIIDAGEETIYRVKEKGGDGVALYGHEFGEKALDKYLDKYSEEDRRRYIEAVKQKLSFFAVRSERSILEAIYSLAKSIELRDRRTREHCDRMSEYAEKMARKLGMNEHDVDNVRRAAMLHDIGKLGISDKILLKPGKLTPEEFEVVKNHPVIGADIISVAGFLKEIVPIILCHHERWDGTGYPRGLKGEEIPLGARVIAVVDVYEAVTSERPYHRAVSKEEAIKILKEGAGTQFDEQIVKIFLEVVE